MTALRWIARHWYLPALAVLAGVAFFFGAKTRPGVALRRELTAIDAGEAARLSAIEKGKDLANSEIDAAHIETILALSDAESVKAETLRRDPARRVRFLTRVAERRADDPI